MKIVLVSGSSRKGSQSLKIATWLDRQLRKLDVEAEIVDLQKYELPVRFDTEWPDTDIEPAKKLQAVLESADGFVVVSPEWNGMAAPALKNMFVYVEKSMAHKPALLTSVSAGRGGSYPIAELRMSSYKNSYVNYIPEHLIITEVNSKFASDEVNEGEKADQYLKNRAVHSLKLLIEYTKALRSVRQSGAPDYEAYPNGM